MAMFSARRCILFVVVVVVLTAGIVVGAMFPSVWPFGKAPPTGASTSAAISAAKIAEEWGSGLEHGQKLTMTAGPKAQLGTPTVLRLGNVSNDDSSATAFVVFMTRAKFEDVWKHYAQKCGYDGPTESLPSGTRMNPEDVRGGMQFGQGKDQLLEVDFAGIGSAAPGVDPAGGRESHFAKFTDGYVVHVVIEEIGKDRWESYKGQVNVRVFAAVR